MSDFSLFGGRNRKKKEAPSDPPQSMGTREPAATEIVNQDSLDSLLAETAEAAAPISSEGQEKSAEAAAGGASAAQPERRGKRRALISAPVRVRGINLTKESLDEITTTINVSRKGILLETTSLEYVQNLDVMVTFPYSKTPGVPLAEQTGRVVRVKEVHGGRRAVAIALGVQHADEEFIGAGGERLQTKQSPPMLVERDANSLKPLVLALDAEETARESLKAYLASVGYEVIAVRNAQEAREVLEQCTPSLLIAQIEGEGMPGYDICAHCKSTPRLRSIPVMLTTTSAYPSDYANAHSLGAVVCMATPYRQERLGHVVRLLAPPHNANEMAAPPRPADPSRRPLGNGNHSSKLASNTNRRFRFGRKS
jgi:CheY-like chemotaxis protein